MAITLNPFRRGRPEKARVTVKKRKSRTPRPKPVPNPSGYLVPLDRTMPAIPVAGQDPKPVPPAPGWENLCKDATNAGLAGLLREIVQVRRVADRNHLPTRHLTELIHRATVMGFHLDPAPPVQYGQWHAENAAQATRSEFLRAATAILRRFADRTGVARAHRRPLLAWDARDKDDEARLLQIADALDGGQGWKDAVSYVPLRERIVQLCDEMLSLGRDPGSGVPFVVSAQPPGKQGRGSREDLPETEQATAVGEHRHMSGPSGFFGKGGRVWDDEWDALAGEFDDKAERLADLVKALDPSYDTGTFYSPEPMTVWEAYPKARKAFTEAERKWHRDYELAHGKTEAEADAILDGVDRAAEGYALTEWTKMQWPGFVREVGGHRVFMSGPALVHAFDRRFKALRRRAERFHAAPGERAESQGARPGGDTRESGGGFVFGRGQVLYNGNDLDLPAGLPIEVLKALHENLGRVVAHKELEDESRSSEASEQLRSAVKAIRNTFEKAKVPYEVRNKRGEGYLLRCR